MCVLFGMAFFNRGKDNIFKGIIDLPKLVQSDVVLIGYNWGFTGSAGSHFSLRAFRIGLQSAMKTNTQLSSSCLVEGGRMTMQSTFYKKMRRNVWNLLVTTFSISSQLAV